MLFERREGNGNDADVKTHPTLHPLLVMLLLSTVPEKEVEKKMGAHCIFTLHFIATGASKDCMSHGWAA